MSWKNRVAWSQGMFLQPQHFQQEARSVERAIDVARNAAAPYAWGFSRLVLDEAALTLGRIAIAEAEGVLPDGSPFSIPLHEPAPAPLARQGAVEFDYGDATDPALARFGVDTRDTRDQSSVSSDSAPIQVGR